MCFKLWFILHKYVFQAVFEHLPGNRTTKLKDRAAIESYLSMKCSKIKLQKHIKATENIFMSIKDLKNIEQSLKLKKRDTLKMAVDLLENHYRKYTKIEKL